jgi:hypothetical protein
MFRLNLKRHPVLAVLLLGFASSAFAQNAAPPAGTWGGVLYSTANVSTRVRVDADFDAKRASLHFDEPFNCRVDASFRETDQQGSHYVFKPSVNGGAFCQKLYRGKLTATLPAAGSLSLSLYKSLADSAVEWSGSLTPDTVAPAEPH